MRTIQQDGTNQIVVKPNQNMYVFVNQGQPNSKSINSNLMMNQSHRGSQLESSLLASGPSINTINNTLATSPIVGRYRLKHLNNAGNQVPNVYHNNTNRALTTN